MEEVAQTRKKSKKNKKNKVVFFRWGVAERSCGSTHKVVRSKNSPGKASNLPKRVGLRAVLWACGGGRARVDRSRGRWVAGRSGRGLQPAGARWSSQSSGDPTHRPARATGRRPPTVCCRAEERGLRTLERNGRARTPQKGQADERAREGVQPHELCLRTSERTAVRRVRVHGSRVARAHQLGRGGSWPLAGVASRTCCFLYLVRVCAHRPGPAASCSAALRPVRPRAAQLPPAPTRAGPHELGVTLTEPASGSTPQIRLGGPVMDADRVVGGIGARRVPCRERREPPSAGA